MAPEVNDSTGNCDDGAKCLATTAPQTDNLASDTIFLVGELEGQEGGANSLPFPNCSTNRARSSTGS